MEKLMSAAFKLQWAKSHIDKVNQAQVETLHANKNIARFKEGNLKAGGKVLEIDPNPAGLDIVWNLVIADAISNLRASLDHIAWELSQTRNSGKLITRPTAIQFPLFDSRNEARFNDATQFMRDDAAAEIEKFQPYHRDEWPELDWLALLSELERWSKHRVVLASISKVIVSFGTAGAFTVALNDQAQTVFPAELWANRDPGFEPDIFPQVMFDIPGSRFEHVYSLAYLTVIYAFISDKVFPAMARFAK